MRVIVAGSRDLLDPYEVEDAITWLPWPITELVCGMARGVDMNAYLWAKKHGVPVKEFPAAWRDRDGMVDKSAGHRRNKAMAAYAQALLAVWDGQSTGTKHMIREAALRNLPTVVVTR